MKFLVVCGPGQALRTSALNYSASIASVVRLTTV
jgi:hypothetical protein